jgi:hypothetical protein
MHADEQISKGPQYLPRLRFCAVGSAAIKQGVGKLG